MQIHSIHSIVQIKRIHTDTDTDSHRQIQIYTDYIDYTDSLDTLDYNIHIYDIQIQGDNVNFTYSKML